MNKNFFLPIHGHTISAHYILSLAKEAGDLLLSLQNNLGPVHQKKDGSPVTKADQACDQFLRKYLPFFPVVSEEVDSPYKIRSKWDTFWLVDPLDGTKDFIAKKNDFSVCIALIHKNKPVLGLIAVPGKKELFFSFSNQGAFKFFENQLIPLPLHHDNKNIAVVSRFHTTSKEKKWLQKKQLTHLLEIGGSFKFALLAEGKASFYPRFAGSSEWDTAAGQALLEATGGKVLSVTSQTPLTYNSPTLRNPHFVAYSKSALSK